LTIVCVPLGGTLAGSLAIQMLPAFGWRTLFAVGGILPAILALLLLRLLPESPRYLARRPHRRAELARLLERMGRPVGRDESFSDGTGKSHAESSVRTLFAKEFRRDTLALWGAFFSCLLAVYLGFNWVPAMLTGAGMSPATGSAGITAFNLGGVAGAIGGALLFARIGSRPTMLAMAAGAIAGAIVMQSMTISAGSAAAPIILMLGITGGLINAVQTTMYALAAQVYPTIVRATGVGSAIAVGRSGAIVSTYVGAWALESGGSPLFFLLVAAAMVSAFISLALVQRHIRPAGRAV
jgi:AAHS family 4-hydroxybenzoate transporter-like MFS transporter